MRRLLLILCALTIILPVSAFAADADRDGIDDSVDNCPYYWNPEQYDADGDGIGNVCDECTDADGDGYGDFGFPTNTCPEDNCPRHPNPDQTDSDGDDIGDACEDIACGDINANGSPEMDMADLAPFVAWLFSGYRSPASTHIANIGGCAGVDIADCAWMSCYFFSPFPPAYCEVVDPCPPQSELGGFYLESVDGLVGPDTVSANREISFNIGMTNLSSDIVTAFANAFRVYCSTGASWNSSSISRLYSMNGMDLARGTIGLGITGTEADTLGCYGAMMMAGGLPSPFDSVSYRVDIGPIDVSWVGHEICLDSCWFPPIGEWLWSMNRCEPYTTLPSWDGPHCFTVVRCCDPRGDIDNNGTGPDIADLVYLVSYMFQDGPAPVCPEKADINGDSIGPDIADLVYLVTYMFQDGPPPAPCD